MKRPFENRLGRFRISRDNLLENPDRARELLSQCVVVRCEMSFVLDSMEYTAFSPAFERMCEGCEPKYYEVVMTMSLANNHIRCRQPWEFRDASKPLAQWEHPA